MSDGRCSTIEGSAGGTVIATSGVALLAVVAAVGLLLAVASDFAPVARGVCFVVAAGLLFAAWKVGRLLFPSEGRLRAVVCDDRIELSRPGQQATVLRRGDIDLVVIFEGNGTAALWFYGPGETLLGMWDTHWVAKLPQSVMRVLQRHGYPYALRSALYGSKLFYRRPGRPVGDGR